MTIKVSELVSLDGDRFPEARFAMGLLYSFGYGVQKDDEAAFKCFLDAAQRGLPCAQYAVGVAYMTGRGIRRDYKAAADWYQQAADKRHPQALLELGLMYKLGKGVTKDYAVACSLFESASKHGISLAITQLAECYEFGRGVGADIDRARGLYLDAAKINDRYSYGVHAVISSLYRDGRAGFPIDPGESERWHKSSMKLVEASLPDDDEIRKNLPPGID